MKELYYRLINESGKLGGGRNFSAALCYKYTEGENADGKSLKQFKKRK